MKCLTFPTIQLPESSNKIKVNPGVAMQKKLTLDTRTKFCQENAYFKCDLGQISSQKYLLYLVILHFCHIS